MKISISGPGLLFGAFYVLSFIATFVIVIIFTLRNKLQLRPVLLMLATVSFMAVAGSRLASVPVSEWGSLIISGATADNIDRSAIGALVFGLLGLLISYQLLGTGIRVISLYSWLAPLGFGLQKIGCFLNGCCFGKVTTLPWGVQYAEGANAHFMHWQKGLIGVNDAFSLPVHPVQLYEAAGLLLIALIVYKTRNFWKKEGSQLLFALVLFSALRFTTEFFRDPSQANGAFFAGLKILQWGAAGAGLISAILLCNIEKTEKRWIPEPSCSLSLPGMIVYTALFSGVILMFRGIFTSYEILSVDIRLLTITAIIAVQSVRMLPTPAVRIASTSILLLPATLLAISLPQQTGTHSSGGTFPDTVIASYRQIEIGGLSGGYLSDMVYNPHEGMCGTAYTHEDYRHQFRVASASYSSVLIGDRITTTTGVRMFGGINREFNLTTDREESNYIAGVSPFLRYDWEWVGFGTGIMIGNLRWIPVSPVNKQYYDSGTKSIFIMPEFRFRVGTPEVLDMRYEFGSGVPAPFPVLFHEFSIGSGFGSPDGFSARVGLSPGGGGNINKFLIVEGQFSRQLGIGLRYNFGSREYYESQYRDHYNWVGLRLSYRFGFN